MIFVLLAVYVGTAIALAYLGRRTRIGAVLLFLISMFLTPLLPAIYVLVVRLEQPIDPVRPPMRLP
jgi:hypothetical protein